MKYYLEIGLGFCGHEGHDVFDADSLEQADQTARDLAYEHARSYFDLVDEDDMEDYDEEDHGDTFIYTSDVDWGFVPYEEAKHEGYLC